MAKLRTKNWRFLKSVFSFSRAPIAEVVLPKSSVEEMFCPRYVSSWCMSKRKRCFDIVLSVAGLVLLSPLMVLIGLLIRMTSEGPALFQQERVGLHQRSFVILKFRTMKMQRERPDGGPTVTRQGDPRMTKIGMILRRMKLDELPQLINVALGDMSFVGPRPKIAQHENLCMLCRPGITGAATIQFTHEEGLIEGVPEELVERYVTTVLNPEKCRLDIHYIETTDFRTDVKILLHTVFKLSNQSRTKFPVEIAQFLVARSAIGSTLPVAVTVLEDGDFVPQKARKSA